MNYEEKYKNLVKAIKEMRDVNPSDEGLQNWISDNVPELAESEDERIRKVLLEIFSNASKNDWRGIPNEKVIAWLEKQGETPKGKTALEAWKDMRLEVYQQASGNRHEPNYSDDTTKMFSLNDIDEIFEKITNE